MKIERITLEQALPVRSAVLWPDKPQSFCIVDGDDEGIHFGAIIDGTVVCVASIYIADNRARLRKFATLHAFQGQGIGSAMLTYILAYLKDENIEHLWCDARESAINFYRRFGMETQGERFFKSDVPYVIMITSQPLNSVTS